MGLPSKRQLQGISEMDIQLWCCLVRVNVSVPQGKGTEVERKAFESTVTANIGMFCKQTEWHLWNIWLFQVDLLPEMALGLTLRSKKVFCILPEMCLISERFPFLIFLQVVSSFYTPNFFLCNISLTALDCEWLRRGELVLFVFCVQKICITSN